MVEPRCGAQVGHALASAVRCIERLMSLLTRTIAHNGAPLRTGLLEGNGKRLFMRLIIFKG